MMICPVTASISPAGPSPNPGWTAGCPRHSGSMPEDSAATAFRRHMLCEMARTSCDDGLVMSLHCGVRRDHHTATAARFGPDVGVDIPIQFDITDAAPDARALWHSFGIQSGRFTVDETVWSRELAHLDPH